MPRPNHPPSPIDTATTSSGKTAKTSASVRDPNQQLMSGVEKYVHLLGLHVRLVTESHVQERPLHRAIPLRLMVPGGGQRNSRGLHPLHRIQFNHEVEVVATCR
ncbi:hypothetical protein BU26DRAFT_556202, partial [Trematosphaeria pertusa]